MTRSIGRVSVWKRRLFKHRGRSGDSVFHPYWNSSAMSTLHHQPVWLSLRNTNQPSALTLLTPYPPSSLLPFFYLFTPSHFLRVLAPVDTQWALHHHFHSGVGVQVLYLLPLSFLSFCFFFVPLVMSGASGEEPPQSGGSREWILMTSTRQRMWGEEVWGRIPSIYFPSFSSSVSFCLRLTCGPRRMQPVCVYRLCLPLIVIN